MRPSGRAPDQLRPIELIPGVSRHAEGSCLAKFGDTHVLCTASIEDRVPPFLRNTGRGWVTAEYGMLPIKIDCDVLQADGGTRTASVTGAWVALRQAVDRQIRSGLLARDPVTGQVAAVSCGIHEGTPVLDLDYPEDSNAHADANFVLTGAGGIVEIQGTAEKAPFSEAEFLALLGLARKGVDQLCAVQRAALGLSG